MDVSYIIFLLINPPFLFYRKQKEYWPTPQGVLWQRSSRSTMDQPNMLNRLLYWNPETNQTQIKMRLKRSARFHSSLRKSKSSMMTPWKLRTKSKRNSTKSVKRSILSTSKKPKPSHKPLPWRVVCQVCKMLYQIPNTKLTKKCIHKTNITICLLEWRKTLSPRSWPLHLKMPHSRTRPLFST